MHFYIDYEFMRIHVLMRFNKPRVLLSSESMRSTIFYIEVCTITVLRLLILQNIHKCNTQGKHWCSIVLRFSCGKSVAH